MRLRFKTQNDRLVLDKCRKFHDKEFEENDSNRPVLPVYRTVTGTRNCRCYYELV